MGVETISKRLASMYPLLLAALCLVQQVTICDAGHGIIKELKYEPDGPLKISMGSSYEVTARIKINKTAIPANGADRIAIKFHTFTISPPFHILGLDPNTYRAIVDRYSLDAANYSMSVKLKLSANYIGHAALEPISIEYTENGTGKTKVQPLGDVAYRLPITIVQNEGIWGQIFIVSVIILMIISYINLGAQLDEENMRQVIKRPMTLILGFLISVFVMPIISWFIGKWLFTNQTLYRVGSFVFACSSAASASTLWTVMLNSDKELSVGLQVLSNIGGLVTMPLLLYGMELSLKSESIHHITVVPYGRLLQALSVLLIALLIGWRFVGRNEQAQKLSRKIFRPLVFFVLIFIVVFSSVLYWHIYQMFSLRIMLASSMITLFTYVISGLLGHLVSCDFNKAVAITIGSAYKNSGITFAALLVAFGAPDTYIAYVPCLAQIIITSMSLYLTYAFLSLIKCIKRCGRAGSTEDVESGADKAVTQRRRNSSGDSRPSSAARVEENDELVAMNVTDIDAGPSSQDRKHSIEVGQPLQQTEVKVISTSNTSSSHTERLVTNV